MILSNDHAYTYNFRKEVIQRLLDDGYKVCVVLPYGESVEKLKEMGCDFYHISLNRRGKNIFQDINLLMNYYKILKKVKPSLVLTYTLKPNLYGSIACQIMKVPHINNITGLGSAFIKDSWGRKILLSIYKIALRKSTHVFCQNSSDLNFLKNNKIINENSSLIPGSGVNLSEFIYSEMESYENKRFLYIGRIMKDKGIDEYLLAAKNLKLKYPNAQFEVVGYVEPSQLEYEEKLKRLHEEKIINYMGYSKNVKPIIQNTQCIIQPSHGGEGISNVLLESGAMGKLLIASNIPGCKETIDNGKNGYIFEVQNHIHLQEQIEKVIKLDVDKIKTMGRNSRIKMEKEFDREIVVSEYSEKINQILLKG